MLIEVTRFDCSAHSRTRLRTLALASATVILVFSATEAQAEAGIVRPTITNIPDLLAGTVSFVNAISGDGTVVVGNSQVTRDTSEAYRWTAAGGTVSLGVLPGSTRGNFSTYASAVNTDGTVIVGFGNASTTNKSTAFRWTSTDGLLTLPTLEYYLSFTDTGVSGDGTIVVGTLNTSSTASDPVTQAFRWTAAGGIVGLGASSTGSGESSAAGISSDGTVIVGQARDAANKREAFRWTQSGGFSYLGYIGTGGTTLDSAANAANTDGSVIVGRSTNDNNTTAHRTYGQEAFRWTQSGGMVGLGFIGGGGTNPGSEAKALSSDGFVVVGTSTNAESTNQGTREAFRWTRAGGIQSLSGLLTAAGVNLGTQTLSSANGVSANGEFIVGDGSNGAYIIRYTTAAVTPTPVPTPTPTPIPPPATPTPITGIITQGIAQGSISQLGRDRAGAAQQMHGFAATLLGDNGRISGGSDVGAFGSVGSLAGGLGGRVNLGGGVTVLAGLSISAEDYAAVRTKDIVLIAGALRYSYAVSSNINLVGEVGGWFSPSGTYTFLRSYANGASTATGIGTASAKQDYLFGRLGLAFNPSPSDEIGLTAEYGRQNLRVDAYDEPLLTTNPFEAHVAASRDRSDVFKARLQVTHSLSKAFDLSAWGAYANNSNLNSTARAVITGVGTFTPSVSGSSWAEFGGRVGYNVSVDLFADGVTGQPGTPTRVHVGAGFHVKL